MLLLVETRSGRSQILQPAAIQNHVQSCDDVLFFRFAKYNCSFLIHSFTHLHSFLNHVRSIVVYHFQHWSGDMRDHCLRRQSPRCCDCGRIRYQNRHFRSRVHKGTEYAVPRHRVHLGANDVDVTFSQLVRLNSGCASLVREHEISYSDQQLMNPDSSILRSRHNPLKLP